MAAAPPPLDGVAEAQLQLEYKHKNKGGARRKERQKAALLTRYIFPNPAFTFPHPRTPTAMVCSCAECSWNGPVLTCVMRARCV